MQRRHSRQTFLNFFASGQRNSVAPERPDDFDKLEIKDKEQLEFVCENGQGDK